MFDLSKEKINVKCDCGKSHIVSFNQVANNKVIKCSCGKNIQLKDSKGSVKKGIDKMNNAVKDLENAFKR